MFILGTINSQHANADDIYLNFFYNNLICTIQKRVKKYSKFRECLWIQLECNAQKHGNPQMFGVEW